MDVSQVPSARRVIGAASGCQPLNSPQTSTSLASGACRVKTVSTVFGAGGVETGAMVAGFAGGFGAATAIGGATGLGVGAGVLAGFGGTTEGTAAGLGVTTGAADLVATAGLAVADFVDAALEASGLTDFFCDGFGIGISSFFERKTITALN